MGRIPIPVCLLNERRKMTVMLKTSGLTNLSVLQEINRLAETKNWGKISLRTLESDIAAHFREHKAITLYELDHIKMMRECHLAQMENTMEELALMILEKNKKNSWKPFEKAIALEKHYKMQQSFAQIQGWDLGKKHSYEIFVNQFGTDNRDLEVFRKAGESISKIPEEERNQLSNLFEAFGHSESGVQMGNAFIKMLTNNNNDELEGEYY